MIRLMTLAALVLVTLSSLHVLMTTTMGMHRRRMSASSQKPCGSRWRTSQVST